MFIIPDAPPNITCIDFAVVRAGGQRPAGAAPETKRFLYDPEENVTGVSLNNADTDFNQYLQALAKDASVTSANVSISFDHGVRPVLAIPIKGACPDLDNIGALVGMVATMMQAPRARSALRTKKGPRGDLLGPFAIYRRYRRTGTRHLQPAHNEHVFVGAINSR